MNFFFLLIFFIILTQIHGWAMIYVEKPKRCISALSSLFLWTIPITGAAFTIIYFNISSQSYHEIRRTAFTVLMIQLIGLMVVAAIIHICANVLVIRRVNTHSSADPQIQATRDLIRKAMTTAILQLLITFFLQVSN